MASDPLRGIPVLGERRIGPGERWIFSAGFNVDARLTSTGRIDSELPDLARLAEAGARVAVLSHQGSHRDGTAVPLPHIASYLARELGRPVRYFPENATPAAEQEARAMGEGEIVLFGNSRAHAGEERDDPELARRFAALGDHVAVGGFSKAHRAHASNTGLLRHRTGCAATSLVAEVRALAPWADGGSEEGPAAVVLGGRKPEKTLVGLAHLTGSHDLVVPAGVVLNTVLKSLGHEVGASDLGERPEACELAARQALTRPGGARVHLPRTVLVAPADRIGQTRARPVEIADGVPAGHAIVDFVVRPWALELLARAGSAVVAGTPSRYLAGHTVSSDAILAALSATSGAVLLLGGDTVAELPWSGATSTGGGSALTLIVQGTCAVLEALRRDDAA
ncbi:phosphoglycerate kinase [Streptomyces sp. NPDC058401]|uniref:phosphoglycerate kinase n=1 Tax=Streptomyces sp. NPDC058401 TaxID=3346480 RepID=UPI00366782EC